MESRAREKRDKTEEKIHEVLDFWRRRVAWYNEDQSSPESQEKYHMHCFKFGDGIDASSRLLANDWTQYKYGTATKG